MPKKHRVLILFFSLIILTQSVAGFAQTYANDWINYAQTYYKIPIVQEGIYQLTYADLQNANFPVDKDPRFIQLFHRGVEVAIEVAGQGDAVFDPADFIRFYGQGNDGTLDQQLYTEPSAQPHQYYNLYSDTTAYFLTRALDTSLGKRIDDFFENNVSGIPTDDFQFDEILLINTEEYATGFTLGDYIQLTAFDYAEGWSGKQIQEGAEIDYSFTGIANSVTSSTKPSIEIQLMGRDDKQHNVEVLIGQNGGSLRVLETALFNNYVTYTISQEIEWTDISATGELTIRVRALGVNGANDLISTNYIKLRYSQTFDMESAATKYFNLKENVGDKSYVEILNKPAGVILWDITEDYEPLEIGYNNVGSDLNAIVSNTTDSRKLIATADLLSPISITKHNFVNFEPVSYDYYIISHQDLMKPGGQYSNVVNAYANYRGTESGGGYQPLILDIEDVYNQFNYGEYSPLAIYQLVKYLYDEGDPKHLFIIGKGLLINTKGSNEFYRNSPELFIFKDLVPTAGVPGSDLTFSLGLSGGEGEVAIPTGRIIATEPIQVANYLDKVISHESQPNDDLWRKRILHLSGGNSTSEQARFKGYVDDFKTIAETHYLGGKVTSLKKQTSAVDEFVNVTDEINEGLGLITFYGHSAPNITDIDIGFVSDPVHDYDNKDKYPLILVNGCNAGQIYSNGYGWDEDWVFTPDKGAIGFIAHSYFGLESSLADYSNSFYEKAFGDSLFVDKPIGVIQQATINNYLSMHGTGLISQTITQQMVLEGDPAVAVFGAGKVDYSTDNNSVFLLEKNGQEVNVLADSFAIGIIVENTGRTEMEDLNVRVSRRLEDNSIINYDTVFAPVLYRDTLYVTINNDVAGIEGRNIFEIELDYVNITDELNENNNSAVIETNLLSNGTKNILPVDFSIISDQNIKLIAQSSNLSTNLDSRSYDVELDTVSTFDSAFKNTMVIIGEALTSLDVTLLSIDSLTYYWRTRFTNPLSAESDDWQTSSFTYIENGTHGWLQSHRQQYSKNEFVGLTHNDIVDEFSFENITADISVTTYGASHPSENHESVELIIDNQPFIYTSRFCRDNTINIVAFNKLTTTPYAPIPSFFQIQQTCGRTDQVVNNFDFEEISEVDEHLKATIDAVGEGDIVLIFSIGDIEFNNWDAGLKSQIERVGGLSSTISSLDAGVPYILLGRKGAIPGSAMEVISFVSPADEQTISLSETILGVQAQGEMRSTTIGPTANWNEFFDQLKGDDPDFNFEISGVDYNGNETTVTSTADKNLSLTGIDADQYPYLKLTYQLDDPDNLTPTQLAHWGVKFEPVPEGVLIVENKPDNFSVEEGEVVTLGFQFINISNVSYPEDLQVNYSSLNRDTRVLEENTISINSPAPDDTTFFSIAWNTIGKVGRNDLNIIVNPRITPELYYDNNQLQLFDFLKVTPDKTAPVVDVVFDGVHIEDGGIVAASPSIEIIVYDDNESIYITDTTGIEVFIKAGCETCEFERLNFDSDSVDWSPASLDEQFKILYTPSVLTDSVYTLRVIASDASGNKPDDKPYEISFTTDAISSVAYYQPYPNPSSDEINFIFEIRGSEAPEELLVDIYSMTGELITTIRSSQLRVGSNKVKFQWSELNTPIPNGIYIYQINVLDAGEQILLKNSLSNGKGRLFLYR